LKKALITGGSGFFGSILERRLLEEDFSVINIDLVKDDFCHENHTTIQGDISDETLLKKVFEENRFDCVFHCAAILAHAVKDKQFLWESNVEGTRNVAEMAARHNVKQLVFTSSNCLWAENFHRPVLEDDVPNPVEIYGKSKLEGEKILLSYRDRVNSVIIRCPTIMDAGRMGLLGILFECIGTLTGCQDGRNTVFEVVFLRFI